MEMMQKQKQKKILIIDDGYVFHVVKAGEQPVLLTKTEYAIRKNIIFSVAQRLVEWYN